MTKDGGTPSPTGGSKPPASSPLLVSWRRGWRAFSAQHREWVECHSRGEAAYSLPTEVILELSSPRGLHRRVPPILKQSQAEAERDFLKLCEAFHPHAIGVYEASPLIFPLLSSSWPVEGTGEGTVGSMVAEDDKNDRHELAQITSDHHQQLAYAGALSFHAPYRQELTQLRGKWQALPKPKPAIGPFISARLASRTGPTDMVLDYYRTYDEFRARWHVAMLVSWDIPWPMGRGDQLTAAEVPLLFGDAGTFDYCPPFLESPRRSVREKGEVARAMARHFPGQPTPPSMGGIVRQGSGPSEYETSFRMWLTELTVQRRIGARRGVTQCLIRGFSRQLRLSEDHVRRLRRIYQILLSSSFDQ